MESFTEKQLNLKLQFDHPEYISNGIVDVLHVELFNTEAFLEPKVEGKEAIPEGYQIVIELPSQSSSILTLEQAETIEF